MERGVSGGEMAEEGECAVSIHHAEEQKWRCLQMGHPHPLPLRLLSQCHAVCCQRENEMRMAQCQCVRKRQSERAERGRDITHPSSLDSACGHSPPPAVCAVCGGERRLVCTTVSQLSSREVSSPQNVLCGAGVSSHLRPPVESLLISSSPSSAESGRVRRRRMEKRCVRKRGGGEEEEGEEEEGVDERRSGVSEMTERRHVRCEM